MKVAQMSIQPPRRTFSQQRANQALAIISDAGTALEHRYLSLAELSEATGLSKSTLIRRFKEGKLPGYQPGGPRTRIVFRSNALELAVQPELQEPSPSTTKSPRLSGPSPRWARGLR